MAEARSLLRDYQYAFTAHIRDPRAHSRPAGVPAARMRVYNELLYNNVEGFLLACFPVTRKVLGQRSWSRLVRAFFAGHRCRSPLFRQIPEEFMQWLQGARAPQLETPPFLAHLAHYEWAELAVDTSPLELPLDQVDPDADLLAGRPALNPVSMQLSYPFPVHRIGPRFKPQAPDTEATHLLVVRDRHDKVRFDVLNLVTARLLTLLQPGTHTGRDAALRVAAELGHPDREAVVEGARRVLDDLRAQDAVLGTWR